MPAHKRKLKNFLLDPSFQLKYAGFISVVVALISVALGVILWDTSQSLVSQSREAVLQGQRGVELAQQVAAESRKVTEVVRMNIVKDPVYGDNPELLEAFQADTKKQDAELDAQQRTLRAQAETLEAQAQSLEEQQQMLLLTLFAALFVLVIVVGLAGIVITHKVAGPVFKMTRQIRELGDGKWRVPAPLRKGDELGYFFEAFEHMVKSLRARQERELDKLDHAVAMLEKAGREVALLKELQAEMRDVIDT